MLHNQPEIKKGLDYFLSSDPRFQTLLPNGHVKHRDHMMTGLSGLSRIVIGQQISAKVAQNLWLKYQALCDPSDPQAVLSLSDADLRRCGFSGQKITYIRGAAQAILDDHIDPDEWASKNEDEITAIITSMKGFGPWSAQIYLLFYMGKGNVWPAGDLGIQIGLQTYACLDERPDEQETRQLGEQFAPYKSAAALLLWDIKDGGV